MARTTKQDPGAVADYRYDAKRKNIPEAGLAAQGRIEERPKLRYAYDPHLPPVLRFDPTGAADRLPELLETARTRALTDDEARLLADALRNQQPWLEWSGKQEAREFAVDPVALNIHERVAAKAVLAAAARQDVQRSLFADDDLGYRERVQFYGHDVDWANRLILGDSLQVMASLIEREGMAGKVQMIYVDPPYGIKFASNFQPIVGKRDVSEKANDLTREPEMVRAYRDTWNKGVHSYLGYLKQRLSIARNLLSDQGSIFVQIGDENVHRVRGLMDEILGVENFVAIIFFSKTSGSTSLHLSSAGDYVIWYARDARFLRFNPIFRGKSLGENLDDKYTSVLHRDGQRTTMSLATRDAQNDGRIFRYDNLLSQSLGREKGEGAASWFPVGLDGFEIRPNLQSRWKTNESGMERLKRSERLATSGSTLSYIRFLDDFPVSSINSLWDDVGGIQSRSDPKVYVVQTNTKVIERCLLMTTDPGDLVLDPTSGSGTTAYVAEKWGRRWIAIDTSRVANAIARQRLLTAASSRSGC